MYDVEILLVEDNPHEAELIKRSLRKGNLANRLLHLDDGADAINFLFAQEKYEARKMEDHPKLVILDLKLPKVNGLEILRRLKSDDQTRMIPVIILTSSREEQDIATGYQYGVNSYVVKPVNFESFEKAVIDLGLYWLFLSESYPAIGQA